MILFSIIFVILLFLSNAFLFKEGIWLYQDQSFWFKNALEVFAFLNTQFHSFNNLSYYLGYDQGILSANNIVTYGSFNLLFTLFGSSGSQIAVSVVSYIIAFFSFWVFVSLFFKDKKLQILLALVYTFNPLLYSFRGQGFIYAAAPLFIYSFYRFYAEKKISGKFLLLNIIACFLWVANVRFLEANLFIIIPYLLFALLILQKQKLQLKRIFVYLVVNIFIFSPVIYSLLAPLLQKSPSIFNYGNVFNGVVVQGLFFNAFNPFQSANLILYDNHIFKIFGLTFFILLFLLLLRSFKKTISPMLTLNISLLVLGMTLFELGYAGKDVYQAVIKIVPFLTNEPFYGLYIINVPMIMLLGIIGEQWKKTVYYLSFSFIFIAILPLLQFSYFPLQKYSLKNLPSDYQEYFVKPFYGIPEASDYIPFDCWRAKYMDAADTPTQCINRAIQYPGIALDNPRTISGQEYYVIKSLYLNANINNLRITHNLKNVIVAKDIVAGIDAGPLYSDTDIEKTKQIDKKLQKNKLLGVNENENFDQYYFKNKNDYDFFLYSPEKVVVKNDIDAIFDNSLSISPPPVVLSEKESMQVGGGIQTNVHIVYKQSQFDPTQYLVKINNINESKPFLIHLTQAYKPGWELTWITKKEYEEKPCVDNTIMYAITNNSRCSYKNLLLDISTLNFLNKKSVSKNDHFQGNFLTNTWLVQPAEIPQYAKDGQAVYAVVIYKNQLYYLYTLLLAGSVLLFVVIYTLMQEGKNSYNKICK